jgi:hypothetical protein
VAWRYFGGNRKAESSQDSRTSNANDGEITAVLAAGKSINTEILTNKFPRFVILEFFYRSMRTVGIGIIAGAEF